MKNTVAIIDYGTNNILSILKAFNRIDVKAEVVTNYKKLKNFNNCILPGVGSFDKAIENLDKIGFKDEICNFVSKGHFILGICLGMQLLFEKSDEGKLGLAGLSLVEGECKKLENYKNLMIQVPHMGWNSLKIKKTSKLLKNVKEEANFYFVHSYYVLPSNSEYTVAVCKHGIEFTAAFENKNIMGVQFHPEKCSTNGLNILKQFSLLS